MTPAAARARPSPVRRVLGLPRAPVRLLYAGRFLVGSLLVLLLPVAFIPLLGYAIAATRAAETAGGPPPLRVSVRLVTDGFWTATVLLLLSAQYLSYLQVSRIDGSNFGT